MLNNGCGMLDGVSETNASYLDILALYRVILDHSGVFGYVEST